MLKPEPRSATMSTVDFAPVGAPNQVVAQLLQLPTTMTQE